MHNSEPPACLGSDYGASGSRQGENVSVLSLGLIKRRLRRVSDPGRWWLVIYSVYSFKDWIWSHLLELRSVLFPFCCKYSFVQNKGHLITSTIRSCSIPKTGVVIVLAQAVHAARPWPLAVRLRISYFLVLTNIPNNVELRSTYWLEEITFDFHPPSICVTIWKL